MMYRPLFLPKILLLALVVILVTGCWSQRPTERWEVATQGIYHGSFNADAEYLAVGSIHHGASLWRTQPLTRQFNWNHQTDGFTEILHTAFSRNGDYALTADYHTLTLWNRQNGEAIWYWSAPARIEAVDLSADGQLALLGLNDNRAVLFDAVNGGIVREFRHQGPVLSVSLSDDATLALTGSQDSSARLWDVADDRQLQRYDQANQVTLVKLSGDGLQALVAASREPAQLWQVESQKRLSTLETGEYHLYRARFTGDNRLLLGTTRKRILQFNSGTGRLSGQWRIGSFWQSSRRSTTVLDMTWRNDRLWALGSDGYLYQF